MMKRLLKDDTTKRAVSIGIIAVGILIVLLFGNVVQWHEIYEADSLPYTVDSGKPGYIDSGAGGIFSFGPYIDLSQGNYEMKIAYDTEQDASFDIVYKNAEGTLITVAEGTLGCDKTCITETFYLDNSVLNQTFEIRTYYPGAGKFQLGEIQIRRKFAVHSYMWVSLAVAIGSIVLLCGRGILYVFAEPKAALYWSGFYTVLACIGIHAMARLQGQSEMAIYIMADLLIILHACGGRNSRVLADVLSRMREKIFQEKVLRMGISTGLFVISAFIVLTFADSMRFQKIYGAERFVYTSKGEQAGYTDSGAAGVFSNGPYINLHKSNYEITVAYSADTDVSFDVIYKNADGMVVTVAGGTLERDKESVSQTFYLENSVFNQTFEIRTFYPGKGVFQLKEVQVRRKFVVHPYIWAALAAAFVSVLISKGRGILSMFREPKEALYWSGFYTLLSCMGIYAMAYSQGQNEAGAYIIPELLIILHAYGGKREIYRKCFDCRMLNSALCYGYLAFTFFILELLMRSLVAAGKDARYDIFILNVFSFGIIGGIVFFISMIPRVRVRTILYGVIYFCFVLLFAVHTVYFQVFGKLFGFQDILLAKEGGDYIDYVLGFFDAKFILTLLGLLAAGIAGIICLQKTVTARKEWNLWIGAAVLSVIFYSHTFFPEDYGEWNSFSNDSYIYATMNNRQRAFELCGFYQYEMKDLKKLLFGNRKADKTQRQEVDAFFERRGAEDAQGQNAMTGMFAGKNMIFVLMESIGNLACREEVMPNLCRMAKEGICFSNMYAPIYGTAATMNAELVTNVGLYAPIDGSMVYFYSDNHFPYSLAARFAENGYTAKQYHYNVAEFYDRNLLNQAFGYEEYVSFLDYAGAESTLDPVLAENDEIYQKLTENERYFDYIISYTAHLSYDDAGENVRYAVEKYPQYTGMTGSDEIDHYFAKARITDDMLGELVQRLEEDGLLENTVIAVIGDHYPYGITDWDSLYRISGVDKYEQLLYKVPCVIWTPGMEPVEVEKTAGTNDFVPTLVNLMGFGDCSMYVGRDIFDESYEGRAYCADGSWISGDCYYHDGGLVYGSMAQEEIDRINRDVMDRITVNDKILRTDYYAD